MLPQRPAAMVAKQAATLDLLSGGRFRLAVGVGWNWAEYEALGADFSTRESRMEEQIEVMRRLWTEPVVDFSGKWVKFETMRMDPKPIQKPHVPIIVGGYADAAFRRAVKFGAGWYGFNCDPARTKEMLGKLDAAFAKAGKKRGPGYQIIITPPMSMKMDAMQEYAALGVDRLVLNLGGQKPEQVDKRLPEIGGLVKMAA
ncbi:MAG: TIGR03619 family F420-dependent LLM class oxidoreductase [Alphaproteobacteria bacterium]|nr:MAG: TIGR03619 family F420-dependent LLM class oxidoreductase [Alphaproteobacteria bacterium]